MVAALRLTTGDKTSLCSDFSTSDKGFMERRPATGVTGVRLFESNRDLFNGIVFDCGVTGIFCN